MKKYPTRFAGQAEILVLVDLGVGISIALSQGMIESVALFTRSKMLVLDQTTPAKVAARAIYERRVGCIVVSDSHGHIVGILTDRDLACQILAFDLSPETPISEIMSVDVLSVSNSAPLSEAIELMELNGIRRIPILEQTENGRHKCVGIVSLDDLIVAQKIDIGQLSKIIKSQTVRKVRRLNNNTRSDERKEQTFNRFFKTMSVKMNLDRELAENVSFHILRQVVQRLPYTEAAHFITQLPSLIQEDLFALPAGPNKSISLDTICDSLKKEFGFSQEGAKEALGGFWHALKDVGDTRELEHVIVQLPNDLQVFFNRRSNGVYSDKPSL